MNRVDACKATGCGHSVVWLPHVRTGNKAPIDFAADENGNCVPLDREGDQTVITTAVTYRVLKKGEYAPMPRHMPHHATCVRAAEFRHTRKEKQHEHRT